MTPATRSRRTVAVALLAALLVTPACTSDGTAKDDRARCEQQPMPGVHWVQCELRGANLKGEDLSEAFLHDVDFAGADLTGVNLTDADITKSTFEDAILFDADLTGALVSGGNIQLAKFCRTKMPTGNVANGDC